MTLKPLVIWENLPFDAVSAPATTYTRPSAFLSPPRGHGPTRKYRRSTGNETWPTNPNTLAKYHLINQALHVLGVRTNSAPPFV